MFWNYTLLKPCFLLTDVGNFSLPHSALGIISLKTLARIFSSVVGDSGQVEFSSDPTYQVTPDPLWPWPIRPGGLPPILSGPHSPHRTPHPPTPTGGLPQFRGHLRLPSHPQEQHPRLSILHLFGLVTPQEGSVILPSLTKASSVWSSHWGKEVGTWQTGRKRSPEGKGKAPAEGQPRCCHHLTGATQSHLAFPKQKTPSQPFLSYEKP